MHTVALADKLSGTRGIHRQASRAEKGVMHHNQGCGEGRKEENNMGISSPIDAPFARMCTVEIREKERERQQKRKQYNKEKITGGQSHQD